MTAREGSFIGRDGAITLAAAFGSMILTAGIAPAVATCAVVRRARRAPVAPAGMPRRILVHDDDAKAARRLLTEAGLGHELRDDG